MIISKIVAFGHLDSDHIFDMQSDILKGHCFKYHQNSNSTQNANDLGDIQRVSCKCEKDQIILFSSSSLKF